MSFVISRTPFRISFFGGGTDYPAWYREEGGAVLSTTIDKYCYISCRFLPPFFGIRHRIVWSHIETVQSAAEILHPAVREAIKAYGLDRSEGIELHHHGDLPARAGMGSSSSFAVGLVNALSVLRGELLDAATLAEKAIDLEQNLLRENVGSQDQVAAAHGGLNRILFRTDGSIAVEPLSLAEERRALLEGRLMLFFTNVSRIASEVARDVIANLSSRRQELREMRAIVDEGVAVLEGAGDLDAFGQLLHRTWTLKRRLGDKVSNEGIDEIYETARRHGAIGGKLLGAGSSGFMLFYVPEDRQADVRSALRGMLHVPFAFERQGSRIIVNGNAAP